MREPYAPSPSIVVGIDGSRTAVGAALWAIDEAISRDIPLRLLCAIDLPGSADIDSPAAANTRATADLAVRHALTAVEATEKPVKVEVEIVQGHPTRALIDASHSATMICVGSVGLNHFTPGRVGSTAAALATSARCPVAIIRAKDGSSTEPGAIVVGVDKAPDCGATVQAAMEEAVLRGARVHALTAWQSRFSDIHDLPVVAQGNRHAHAQLDRRLDRWAPRYPDVEVSSVVVHGSLVTYLAANTDSVQLVVVGARDHHNVAELVGPAGNAALQGTDCSVLIVGRQQL